MGSTKDLRVRWRRHKWDIRHAMWEVCGLTRHFAHCHQGNLEEAINNLQVTILDHLEGDYSEVALKLIEDRWMVNLGTIFQGSNSRNEVLSHQRRNWGR